MEDIASVLGIHEEVLVTSASVCMETLHGQHSQPLIQHLEEIQDFYLPFMHKAEHFRHTGNVWSGSLKASLKTVWMKLYIKRYK